MDKSQYDKWSNGCRCLAKMVPTKEPRAGEGGMHGILDKRGWLIEESNNGCNYKFNEEEVGSFKLSH